MSMSTANISGTTLHEYRSADVLRKFTAAVSLHAHTHHSFETMAFAPRYLERIPLVATLVQRERRAYATRNGRAMDFTTAWWHPPVDPQTVLASETSQIQSLGGLVPIVSVTDHDNLQAGLSLQATCCHTRVPLSFEWTVPFGPGFFHLGVHNLRPAAADRLFAMLSNWTRTPDPAALSALLDEVNADPETLLVLNHPLWDLAAVGPDAHVVLLRRFLREQGTHIHALELNGYRSWPENCGVARLAKALSLPLISGGDRHGRAANSLLNLTTATSFGEFAREIRRDRHSEILVMPAYRTSLAVRKLAVAADAARYDPTLPPGRRHWADRVTCVSEGVAGPLSDHWPNGGPLWARAAVRTFQLLTGPPLVPVAHVMIAVMRLSTSGHANPTALVEAQNWAPATASSVSDTRG